MLSALLNTTAQVPGRIKAQPNSENNATELLPNETSRRAQAEAEFSDLFENLTDSDQPPKTKKADIVVLEDAPTTQLAEASAPENAPSEDIPSELTLATEPLTTRPVRERIKIETTSNGDDFDQPKEVGQRRDPSRDHTADLPVEARQDRNGPPDHAIGVLGVAVKAHQTEGSHAAKTPLLQTEDIHAFVANQSAEKALPTQASAVARAVRSLHASPRDTIAAQNFGLTVSMTAREQQTQKPVPVPFESSDMKSARPPPFVPSAPPSDGSRSERVKETQNHGRPRFSEPAQTDVPQLSTAKTSPPQVTVSTHPMPSHGFATLPPLQAEKSSLLQSVGDAPLEMAWEPTRSQSVSGTPAIVRPEMPVHIARQMADALHRMPDKPIELTLNPLELGRVRLSISAADTGIVVNVLAERTETLELMRRNIDQLGQELRSMGYENISFSFGNGHQQPDRDHKREQPQGLAATDHASVEPVSAPTHINLPMATTGLDIRL